MIKVLDMDGIFDKYISDYVYKNIGKINPEEIENNIPVLYEKFGNEPLKELDGKTPNEYYLQYPIEQLIECLKNHLEQKVSVSDFLCEAIQNNPANEDALVECLKQDNDEEFTLYLMNMLDVLGGTKCVNRFLQFVLWDYSEPIKELATELLCNHADLVSSEIIAQFKDCTETVKGYLTQILSYCKQEDKIFDILIAEFVKNQDNIPLYAGYLAKYGDERALPFLLTAIEGEKINYFDFEELRFAIESLGGQYDKTRDFTADKVYKKIKNQKTK